MFKKASKSQSRLRLALTGPSGSGKTYSALNIAAHLGGSVAVIDTEHGSASKYGDLFNFDVAELHSFSPLAYIDAIENAQSAGYEILVIDSLSHAWMGKDGALEQVDRIAKRMGNSNTFAAWRDVTPMHNKLVESMLACKCHLIVTMRAKTEFALEKDEKGRTTVRKLGLAPVQRDGIEYEMDVAGDLNLEHELVISKSRCPALSGRVFPYPGEEVATLLKQWVSNGSPSLISQADLDQLIQVREENGYSREELRSIIASIQKVPVEQANSKTLTAVQYQQALQQISTPKPKSLQELLAERSVS